VARALLAAAVRACRRHGAEVIEGYPVRPAPDGGRTPAAFAWTGPLSIFEESGFRPARDDGASKVLVRLQGRRR
jgi:hypothetical protein